MYLSKAVMISPSERLCTILGLAIHPVWALHRPLHHPALPPLPALLPHPFFQLLTEAASAWEADLPMPSPASSHCIT